MPISKKNYIKLYHQSINDPESFWGKQSEFLTWIEKWKLVYRGDFPRGINQWFVGGKLNASYNCIDRHLEKNPQKTAIIWQGEAEEHEKRIDYQTLYEQVCQMADLLQKHGIKKGDRILIYMPMIPELVYAVLACARIGAVHSVVFAGFSPHSIAHRIDDCEPSMVISANGGYRNGKILDIKKSVDEALTLCAKPINNIQHLVFRYIQDKSDKELGIVSPNDKDCFWWHKEVDRLKLKKDFPPATMDSEDPLFILYTSGSTGKPKGILHTTAGYLLGASITFRYVFDYQENDIYWCTADVGWITGHSYVIYGPLACGATIVMYEGGPVYPDFGRFWSIVEKFKVTLFYTAPTAIRSFMKESLDYVKKYDLSSLRLLGSVGEPINPESWNWYYNNIGQGKCPIVDTWWQTETGAIMITPLDNAFPLKAGSVGKPFFGIQPVIIDPSGKIQGITVKRSIFRTLWKYIGAFIGLSNAEVFEQSISGGLCIQKPWPSMARGIYGDAKRFYEIYFSQYPGLYFSGDRVHVDGQGYFWINGRVDDVLNVSGHRLGTAEIENAIICHDAVAESAVVGFKHPVKGEGIYAFVTLKTGIESKPEIALEITQTVVRQISKIARPDYIQWAPALPKTRSGKIMRRILRKIANNDWKDLGDTSTLADPSIPEKLCAEYKDRISLSRL